MEKQSIQIFIWHPENQRLLTEWLSSDFLVIDDAEIHNKVDLLIVDGLALKENRDKILDYKTRTQPVFFPVLLLTNQLNIALHTEDVWDFVDDVLESPTQKVVLQSHLKVLLRTRNLSETMYQQSLALSEQKTLSEVLLDSAMSLTSTLNVEEVFKRILENINRIIHQDAAAIFLIENGYVMLINSHGYPDYVLDEARTFLSQTSVAELPCVRELVEKTEPVYIEDLSNLQLPYLKTSAVYVMTPIVLEENMIGFITFEKRTVIGDRSTNSRYLRAFAAQVASAIQNARLYARAQSAAVYEERQRLARDFHDSVTQTLFSASMIAEAIIRSNVDDDLRDLLVELHQLTRGALAETRTLLLELKPTKLLETDFSDLLRQLAESLWSRKQLTIDLQLDETVELPLRIKVAFYRIAQEALHNIRKHSDAKQITVYYSSNFKKAEMIISDDGIGFDIKNNRKGLGLNNMNARAASIGAKFDMSSEQDSGTKIHIVWYTGGELNV